FLARVDSSGTFEWGVAPPSTVGSGQFTLGHGNAMGLDADGNVYVVGNEGGTLDWGNGVVTGSGTISDNSMALLSFDSTGLPRWGLQGGSTHSDILYDLAVAPDGVAHFVGITSDPFTLGPYTVDPVNARGTVVARVDPEVSTGQFAGTVIDEGMIALPSVFTDGFLLTGPALSNATSVSVALQDAAGRVVEHANGVGDALGRELAPGAYTVLVRSGARLLRTRVVKV
ncbi:MAG: hypothetical protein ABI432_18530, partial [Flavobacteriales bacterium]